MSHPRRRLIHDDEDRYEGKRKKAGGRKASESDDDDDEDSLFFSNDDSSDSELATPQASPPLGMRAVTPTMRRKSPVTTFDLAMPLEFTKIVPLTWMITMPHPGDDPAGKYNLHFVACDRILNKGPLVSKLSTQNSPFTPVMIGYVAHMQVVVSIMRGAEGRDYSLKIDGIEGEIRVHRAILAKFIPRFRHSSSLDHMQESASNVITFAPPPTLCVCVCV